MLRIRTLSILAGLLVLGAPALDRKAAGAGSEPPAATCLEQLAALSCCELEQLYRRSTAGIIPEGFVRGKVVYCPEQRFAAMRSRVAGTLWRGKHFHGEDATLINQWLGVRAIRARSGYGLSWLDGRTSIILDYCGTSRVWADVRDEMREVAPGLYVGVMYLRRCPEPQMKLLFCLEARACRESSRHQTFCQ